jgi:hypothetical protein
MGECLCCGGNRPSLWHGTSHLVLSLAGCSLRLILTKRRQLGLMKAPGFDSF